MEKPPQTAEEKTPEEIKKIELERAVTDELAAGVADNHNKGGMLGPKETPIDIIHAEAAHGDYNPDVKARQERARQE